MLTERISPGIRCAAIKFGQRRVTRFVVPSKNNCPLMFASAVLPRSPAKFPETFLPPAGHICGPHAAESPRTRQETEERPDKADLTSLRRPCPRQRRSARRAELVLPLSHGDIHFRHAAHDG